MDLCQQSRERLEQYFSMTANDAGAQVGEMYTATPAAGQIIYNKIVEKGLLFLRMINVLPVTLVKGEKIGLSLSGRISSRTNTEGGDERTPKHLAATDALGYECFPTEFDVALTYPQIDSWAKFPDFPERYMKAVHEAIGNDMVLIGWNGLFAAPWTNNFAYPLLQDVNIGWLKQIRDFNGGSQYAIGTVESPIQLGGETFKNLDVLANAAKQRLPDQVRDDPSLVLLVGSDVLSYQEKIYRELNGNTPSEKVVMNGRLITKAYAGMPTFSPPFMPEKTLLITPLENLSIYYQESSVRHMQKDKIERKQVQDFNSVNQAYVVEDFFFTSLFENITYAE